MEEYKSFKLFPVYVFSIRMDYIQASYKGYPACSKSWVCKLFQAIQLNLFLRRLLKSISHWIGRWTKRPGQWHRSVVVIYLWICPDTF